jgi:hypothetical protein
VVVVGRLRNLLNLVDRLVDRLVGRLVDSPLLIVGIHLPLVAAFRSSDHQMGKEADFAAVSGCLKILAEKLVSRNLPA